MSPEEEQELGRRLDDMDAPGKPKALVLDKSDQGIRYVFRLKDAPRAVDQITQATKRENPENESSALYEPLNAISAKQ
jgi:hypothetical protein